MGYDGTMESVFALSSSRCRIDANSPYTFEELQRLEAPSDGLLTLMARTYPVRPGDWAFGVADTSHPESNWVEVD